MDNKEPVHKPRWAWRERSVDIAEEHFELRYGSAQESGWDSWRPVAIVGRPRKGVFGVQFMIDRATPDSAAMVDAVVAELDYYLVTLGEPNPWRYAQYHCSTSANIYSSVHWSFHKGKRGKEKEARG